MEIGIARVDPLDPVLPHQNGYLGSDVGIDDEYQRPSVASQKASLSAISTLAPQSDQFVPTSFSSALRTNRFNDIPSLIDFRTARLWRSGDTLTLKVPL